MNISQIGWCRSPPGGRTPALLSVLFSSFQDAFNEYFLPCLLAFFQQQQLSLCSSRVCSHSPSLPSSRPAGWLLPALLKTLRKQQPEDPRKPRPPPANIAAAAGPLCRPCLEAPLFGLQDPRRPGFLLLSSSWSLALVRPSFSAHPKCLHYQHTVLALFSSLAGSCHPLTVSATSYLDAHDPGCALLA